MLVVLGLMLAAVFAGVAVYVLWVEHPARRLLDPAAQLTQWKPSYHRGAILQASSAALGAIVGVAGFVRWHDAWMLAGGGALLAAIGYTFAVMWALNGRIKATVPAQASAETVAMWRAGGGCTPAGPRSGWSRSRASRSLPIARSAPDP